MAVIAFVGRVGVAGYDPRTDQSNPKPQHPE